MKRSTLAVLAYMFSMLLASGWAEASLISADDYYVANDTNQVSRYASDGSYLGSFTVGGTGTDVRGMAFDQNGLMYAVRSTGSGLGVTTLDANGVVRAQYSAASYVYGNLSFGAIAIGANGKFYVASQDSLLEFTPGVPQGKAIYTNNQVFDVKVLPSGHLLVLSAYALDEILPSGALVRHVNTPYLVDARGVAYDAAHNDIFISMLGDTGRYFMLMRVNGSTGALEASTRFWYGSDMLLTADDHLLVGSNYQAPELFDLDLHPLRNLGTAPDAFVAQFAPTAPSSVPEPAGAALLLIGATALAAAKRRRS